MFGNDTDSITRSLSKRSRLVVGKLDHSFYNHAIVLRWEERWSQVLNHVIKHEEAKLEALLNVRVESYIQGLCAKGLN